MRSFLLWCLLIFPIYALAEDIIVFNNGDIEKVKVIEIGQNEIKYKKISNLQGPTYSIGKSEILSVTYENGDVDKFGIEKCSKNEYIKRHPSARNADMIALYNPQVYFNLKHRNKKSKNIFAVMNIAPSSVLANEDIEISLIRKCIQTEGESWLYTFRYYIQISNKTDDFIYIDKGCSFRSINNISTPYYDSKQIGVSSESGGGLNIGLGAISNMLGIGGTVGQLANGISIGGGQSSGSSTIYTQQRILSIPPQSSIYLSQHIWDNKTQISEGETFMLNDYENPIIEKGECLEFNEQTAPYTFKYFITYSLSQSFDSFSSISFSLFTRYIVGEALRPTDGSYGINLFGSEDQMNKNICKKITNFESEPTILVGITSRAKY